MRYTGIQPQYFPRLHYFARILSADIFMIRDDAQFLRKHLYPDGKMGKSYQAHTSIKQSFGIQYLHVPTKHGGFKPIFEKKISYQEDWMNAHVKTLQISYGRASQYKQLIAEIHDLLFRTYATIAELNIATILWGVLHLLNDEVKKEKLTLKYVNSRLKTATKIRLKEIKLASQTKTGSDSSIKKNEKIIALCKEVGATEDYCGQTAVDAYMEKKLYKKNGIKITIQNWECKEYLQLFVKQQGFIPNLSIIDLLMNVACSQANKIIQG